MKWWITFLFCPNKMETLSDICPLQPYATTVLLNVWLVLRELILICCCIIVVDCIGSSISLAQILREQGMVHNHICYNK